MVIKGSTYRHRHVRVTALLAETGQTTALEALMVQELPVGP